MSTRLAGSAAADRRAPTRYVAHAMGMPISLALRGRHTDDRAAHDAWSQVMSTLRWADVVFSTYRAASWVSRLGRGEVTVADCPVEVAEVLHLAEVAERESAGAFSIRLRGPDGRPVLDPSGVVKGWAAELASASLRELDETDFCLSAGGDIVCRTLDPSSPPWRVGIEHPHDTDRLVAVFPVRDGGVATSGTAHRGQHLVDARTGHAPERVSQVTVVASTLTWADIDATAAYAQGPAAAAWLATRHGRTALVVWDDGTTAVTQA